MTIKLDFSKQQIDALNRNPHDAIDGIMHGVRFHARIAIPHVLKNINEFYADWMPNGLQAVCQRVSIPFAFDNFGFICEFDSPMEAFMYDHEMALDETMKDLMAAFGPIVLKNVYMDAASRKIGHRNRFPHLNFHYDRSANQPSPYSLFSRDPFDLEQAEPRTSSTVFTPNIVAYLQCLKEGTCDESEQGVRSNYPIFLNEPMNELIDYIMVEHSWDEPHGTGEISMLDNRTVIHASYYRNLGVKGYRIGVRYLK